MSINALSNAALARRLQHYAQDWLAVIKPALKASTHTHYASTLRRYILPLLGTRQVASIKRADCRQLVATCRMKGLKVVTVRGIARTLSTILTQAVEDELLPANPALRMGRYLRHADEPAPDIRPFTRDEVAHMIAVARTTFPEWYPWLLCGLRTGMRAGELLGLQWGDINWRDG